MDLILLLFMQIWAEYLDLLNVGKHLFKFSDSRQPYINKTFSHLASKKKLKMFPQLCLFLFVSPAEPIWSLASVIAIVWLLNTSV